MDKKKIYIYTGIAGIIILSYLSRKPIVKKVKVVMNDLKRKEFLSSITPTVKILAAQIGVPYEFMLAQIALETGWGKSELFWKHFNVGGVKSVKGQPFVSYLTTECTKNGVCTKVYQNFAKYNSLKDGLVAHSKILTNRYFKKYANKTTDPKKYATLLQSGTPRYATDPKYVGKMITLIDQVKLLTA
jgi:flagellar protein FlgJ